MAGFGGKLVVWGCGLGVDADGFAAWVWGAAGVGGVSGFFRSGRGDAVIGR